MRRKMLLIPLALLLAISLVAIGCPAPAPAPPAPAPPVAPTPKPPAPAPPKPAPEPEVEVFPAKPITLIVPFSPGGGTDRVARTIAGTWGTYSDVPLRIVCMPGGGGAEGSLFAAGEKPDGYTLLMGSMSTAIILPMIRDLGYTADDLMPIANISESYSVVVVHPDSPWGTLQEFVAYAKEHPGKVTYGSAGAGTWLHLAGALFEQEAGITLKHVPFDGTGPAQLALLGEHIDSVFTTTGAGVPLVRAGTLRGLAVTSVERVEGSDVPTFREAGFDYEFIAWRGVMAPKGTPKEVIETLEGIFAQILLDKGFIKGMTKLGEPPKFLTTKEFGEIITSQTEALRPVLEQLEL